MATIDLQPRATFHNGLSKNNNNGDYTDKSASPESPPSVTSKNGSTGQKVTYEDPDADVALKSSEGRIFKVESYVLKTHSAYFRKLFKSQGIPKDPISINASTKILKALLDIMHMRTVPHGMVWAYKDKLLLLCDTLGTPSVAERAVFSMHENVHKDPWGVFCLASQRSNISLAKAALRCLADDDEYNKIGRLTPKLAEGVSLPYLLGLFNAALTVRGHEHGEGCDVDGHIGWKDIADNFSPVA